MGAGIGVLWDLDLLVAGRQMIADTAKVYGGRIMMHYAVNGGNIEDAISSASGICMVGSDFVGFTDIDEARLGIDYNTGILINGQERVERGLRGISKISGSTALIGRMGLKSIEGVKGYLSLRYGSRVSTSQSANAYPKIEYDLETAAYRANKIVGEGYGGAHGTKVHSEFRHQVSQLNKSELFTEVSYRGGVPVKWGTRGSVRLDVVQGQIGAPSKVFDLKTGGARLTPARIRQIQSQLPGGKNVPVIEIRAR